MSHRGLTMEESGCSSTVFVFQTTTAGTTAMKRAAVTPAQVLSLSVTAAAASRITGPATGTTTAATTAMRPTQTAPIRVSGWTCWAGAFQLDWDCFKNQSPGTNSGHIWLPRRLGELQSTAVTVDFIIFLLFCHLFPDKTGTEKTFIPTKNDYWKKWLLKITKSEKER